MSDENKVRDLAFALDPLARALFQKALDDDMAGLVLVRLFDGDTVTIKNGEFVFLSEAEIEALNADDEEGDDDGRRTP